LFRRIAEHLICAPHFNRYPWALKEDMQSYALEKMIKNIKNYKQQYRDKCFAYFTRVAETAFIYQLKKHYKQVNI
jgi:DNA-directed RNA polymerase specialized sigma subunit